MAFIKRQKWKDKLRPAKFRGLAFYIDTSTFGTGRRGVLHEFPGRDIPYREDLGRKAKTYPIEGYILGGDYRAQKDKLIAACEKEGPGELVHPYYGKVDVVCEELTVQETSGEGGFCKLSFKFVEAGSLTYPTSLLDNAYLVSAAAGELSENAIASFSETMSISGQVQTFVERVSDKVTGFANTLDGFTTGVSASASDLANAAFAIRDLKANVTELLATPGRLAERMNSAWGFLVTALDPSDLFRAAKSLFSFGSDDPVIVQSTAAKTQQAKNLSALNSLVQILAVSSAAVALTEMEFSSTDDATNAREAVSSHIDQLSLSSTDDEVYNSLQKIRAELVRAVPSPDQNLARIAEYTPPTTVPALALAYDRYGSLNLMDDIISRNNIAHPGFIPGGITLEVLDSA